MSDPEPDPNSDKPAQKLVCLYCQHEIEFGYTFCSNCGKSLSLKICPRCSFTVPIQAQFCVNCGFNLSSTNQSPIRNLQTPVIQQQSFYPTQVPYYYRPPQPKWWKLPAFFIIFCIFGLVLVTNVTSAIFLVLFVNGNSLSTVVASNYEIMAIDILELLFILFALKFFKGFHFFFKKPNDLDQSNSNSPVLQIPNKLSMKKNIIRALMFIILFMSIILLIEDIDTPLIQFLQNFFHSGPTISPYSTSNNNLVSYFFLISFVDCIFAPIVEEIIFRGILQQALDRSGTSDFSHYIIQGIIFSLAHLAGDITNGGSIDFIITHMIFTFVFAICATFLRKKFNSLIPSILLHSLNNSISDFSGFFTPQFFTLNQLQIISILFYILPVTFIIIILALFFLFDGWKFHIPLTLSQDKNNDFTIRIILMAIVIDFLQFTFILIPGGATISFLLGLIVFDLILFIFWGYKVFDIPWKQVVEVSKHMENIQPPLNQLVN